MSKIAELISFKSSNPDQRVLSLKRRFQNYLQM